MTVKGLHVHQDQMDSVDAAESVGLLRIAQRPRQSKASVFFEGLHKKVEHIFIVLDHQHAGFHRSISSRIKLSLSAKAG